MLEVSIRHRYDDATLEIDFVSGARSVALFGDSGAGKTSTLNAIAGLLTPDAGRIAVDGKPWFDRSMAVSTPIRERAIGYVFQDGRLFPHMSVRGNLLFGAHARNPHREGWQEIVELLSLERLLARRPASLSGGERQRVAIARALLSAPRMLLLDEPLTGLHGDARDEVLGHLRRLREKQLVTLLLVSHQPAEVVALADEVILLEDGKVSGQCAIADFEQGRGPRDQRPKQALDSPGRLDTHV